MPGRTNETIMRCHRADGGEYADEQVDIVRAQGASEDISERKQAERRLCESDERFRLFSKVAKDPIRDWNLAVNEVWWSEGFETAFGYVRDEIEGGVESWINRIHTEDRARVLADIHRVLKPGNESWSAEYRFQRKNGSYAWVVDSSCVIRDGSGKAVRMIGAMADLSERREIEERLKKLEAQFLRTQRIESIGALASGIAHDLNNVFSPILISIETLKETAADEEGRGLLATLQESAQHGADLVRQVLSFARGVESARLAINLEHLARDIRNIARHTFPKNIQFELRSPHDLWMVNADPTQLHQVLMNLCVNAVEALPGGGKLTLTLQNAVLDEVDLRMNAESKPGPYVLAEVMDTGVGIPREIREQIFEAFFTTKKPGTGLGLSTVLGIVKSHGGFVQVQSEPGAGAKFKVYFPASPAAAPSGGSAARQTPLRRGNGEVVLLVDDEETVRKVAKETLEHFGYRVLPAGHGAEAVALYARHQAEIAVALIDMVMPLMDGPATILALKAMNPAVKIIASSGSSDSGGAASAANAGIQHFVSKPYTAEVILEALESVLSARSCS